MTEYSDNLTVADVEAVLRSLPDNAITGDEIAMILAEIERLDRDACKEVRDALL